jgi:ABC-type antimicrobial peptide transport system permease subunit
MARRDPWLFVGLLGFFGLLLLAFFGERLAPHESDVVWNDMTGPMLM